MLADILFAAVLILVHVLLWPGDAGEQARWTPVPKDDR